MICYNGYPNFSVLLLLYEKMLTYYDKNYSSVIMKQLQLILLPPGTRCILILSTQHQNLSVLLFLYEKMLTYYNKNYSSVMENSVDNTTNERVLMDILSES